MKAVYDPMRIEHDQVLSRNKRLERWANIEDLDVAAEKIRQDAKQKVADAKQQTKYLTDAAETTARGIDRDARERLLAATTQSEHIIAAANKRAHEIAGDAYTVKQEMTQNQITLRAIRHTIDGYGNEYLKLGASLLDELADTYAHTQPGHMLKGARSLVNSLIKDGRGAQCDYADDARCTRAQQFVTDAFNGKVDSILARVKHDNYGKLAQEVRDAFSIINLHGESFRNARITQEFLSARLQELKWATIVHELKLKQREEQRVIQEQIREEEKVRRELEKAQKEASKEEDVLRRALAEAQSRIDRASDEQRAEFEAKMAQLNAQLQEAQDRNLRAVSMAQQTKRGHVYIISNVGSFGEDVYKIGVTRRLEPLDRVRELGDSSVPFAFDVHAMILSDDAPALEHKLHRHFVLSQVNKMNYRKEFFRSSVEEIRREIELLGIEATWTMTADAAEYRETLAIEKRIASDSTAKRAWINRQLVLEAAEVEVDESVEAAV